VVLDSLGALFIEEDEDRPVDLRLVAAALYLVGLAVALYMIPDWAIFQGCMALL
jgi:hypothetical protein